MQLSERMIGPENIYHYLGAISPSAARRFSAILGMGRRIIETEDGSFWIDPWSAFGASITQIGSA